jgi:hypothetical protein
MIISYVKTAVNAPNPPYWLAGWQVVSETGEAVIIAKYYGGRRYTRPERRESYPNTTYITGGDIQPICSQPINERVELPQYQLSRVFLSLLLTESIDHPDVLLGEHLLHLVRSGRRGKVQVRRALPAQQVSASIANK